MAIVRNKHASLPGHKMPMETRSIKSEIISPFVTNNLVQ